jgi:hypothetical protein
MVKLCLPFCSKCHSSKNCIYDEANRTARLITWEQAAPVKHKACDTTDWKLLVAHETEETFAVWYSFAKNTLMSQ